MLIFKVEQDTWEYMLHFMWGVWSRPVTMENPRFVIEQKLMDKLTGEC